VRFICIELERELRERGDLRDIRRVAVALGSGFDRLLRLRARPAEPI
jgi:hypothetical protein